MAWDKVTVTDIVSIISMLSTLTVLVKFLVMAPRDIHSTDVKLEADEVDLVAKYKDMAAAGAATLSDVLTITMPTIQKENISLKLKVAKLELEVCTVKDEQAVLKQEAASIRLEVQQLLATRLEQVDKSTETLYIRLTSIEKRLEVMGRS